MRPRVMAAILGIVLTVGGTGGLAYGVLRMSGAASGDCVGDECLADLAVVAFPLGIVAIVFGLIIASWAIGSMRDERGAASPLRAFGFMTGLGAVFLVMGVILVGGASGTDEGDTMLFVGALFGVMGLAFIAIDLWRFRGELRKDRLRVSGIKGTAKVIDVRDTGVTVNNNPMVNFDLEVSLPGQSPFRTRKRSVISRLSVGALMPGATIPVLADPDKPRSIILDWDAGATAPSMSSASGPPLLTPWLAGPGAFQTAGGAVNAELLRNISQALASAAERAEQGGGAAIHSPGGITAIDGGTTITVDGRQVSPHEVAATLANLPAMLAAIGAGGTATAIAAGAGPGATAASMPSAAVPSVPTMSSVPTISSPGVVTPDVTLGPAPGNDALPGRVSLDTITDTGVDVGGNRLYTFDLTVAIAGRTPYQVKHAATVPKALVPRLIRGASFPAQIDPSQPNELAIAWDR